MAPMALSPKGPQRNGNIVQDAMYAGLFAGAVMGVAETVVAWFMVGDWVLPWRMFASIILGKTALEGPFSVLQGVFGVVVHLALSVAFAVIWAAIVRHAPADIRHSYAAHTAAAMIYGLVLWVVNFQLVARVAYPWLTGQMEVAQLTIHAVAYGLPLGLFLTKRIAWMEPRRPVERQPTV